MKLCNFIKRGVVFIIGFLFLLAVYFFKERATFADPTLIITEMMRNHNGFAIQVERYGSFITQLLPLLGLKIGISLQGIVLLYSISIVLFNAVVVFFLLHWKSNTLLIGFISYLLLLTTDSFYWINSENYVGIAWLILAIGYIYNSYTSARNIIWVYVIGSLLLWLAIFSHPLVVFSFGYIVLYFLITKKIKLQTPYYLVWAFISILIIALKYYYSSQNWYDADKMNIAYTAHNIPHFFHLPSTLQFLHETPLHYVIYFLVLILTIICLIVQKKWQILILLIIYSVLYILLINATFIEVQPTFYMQCSWLVLGLFLGLPFSEFVLEKYDGKYMRAILGCVVLVKLLQITVSHKKFTVHKKWVEQKIDEQLKTNKRKKVIVNKHYPNDTVFNIWSVPYESLILSSMRNPDSACTIAILPNLPSAENSKKQNLFISVFREDIDTFLNREYIRLPLQTYVVEQ